MRTFLTLVFACILALAGASLLWLNHRFELPAPSVDLSIEPGQNARAVANDVVQAGVRVNPVLLYAWFRLSGHSRQIKAGSYELTRDTTPRSLLRKLVQGEESLRTVTLVDGWTFRQVRSALKKADQLKPDTQNWTAANLMAQLGRTGVSPEGRFLPRHVRLQQRLQRHCGIAARHAGYGCPPGPSVGAAQCPIAPD